MTDVTIPANEVNAVRLSLIAALEVAGAASSKATALHTAEQQQDAVRDSVQKLYALDKALPLIVGMQKGVRNFYMREALLNELDRGTRRGRNIIMSADDWSKLNDDALLKLIESLGQNPAQLMRTFAEMSERKVNNARTRRVVLTYLFNHPKLEFWSIKYRAKLREILSHLWGSRRAHAIVQVMSENAMVIDGRTRQMLDESVKRYSNTYSGEYLSGILMFIFGKGNMTYYQKDKFPYISQFKNAKVDVFKAPLIPEEVLVGILGDENHPQHSLWKNDRAGVLEQIRNMNKVETANQAVRKTAHEKKHGITREVSRVSEADDPIALLKTAYANGMTDEINARLLNLAQDRMIDVPYNTVGIIVDRSRSMRGHHLESKDTPRAITEFTERVLYASVDFIAEYTEDGVSDLASAFVRLMGNEGAGYIQAVFVLSDGYENAPYEGAFSDVVKAWNEAVGFLPVYHISPYAGAEMNARARALGDNIASIAATYDTLGVALQAQSLEADVRLWLQNQINLLEANSNGRG